MGNLEKAAFDLAQKNTNQIGDLSQSKAEKTYVDTELGKKTTKTYVDQQITNIGNASPKGTYATLSALQTAFPTGATGIYVVTADGKWYYWNGTTWTAGGVYQATGISDKNITPKKLDRFYKTADSKTVSGVSVTINDADESNNICFVNAPASTTVTSCGKNLQQFSIQAYTPTNLTPTATTDDSITFKVLVGETYKGFKLKPVFLKAGTYAFHREYEIISGSGTGNVGFTYIYASDGTKETGSAVASIGPSAVTATYTVPSDGYYIMLVYANMNGTVSADMTIRIFNAQVEKTSYTSYEKFKGESQTGTSLAFNTFKNMTIFNDSGVSMDITYPPTPNATTIFFPGDSLTSGTGATTGKPASDTNTDVSYPAVLGRKLGNQFNIVNGGVGGEPSWMIAARQGGMPVKVLPTTIPADTSQVRVYLKGQEQDYFYNNTTSQWEYLKDNLSYNLGTEPNGRISPCYINGIKGTLTRTLLSSGTADPTTGETVQTSTYAYYFTRETAGVANVFTSPVDLVTNASKIYRDAIQIIWAGQNDAPLHNGQYITQIGVENRIRAMINHTTSKKYIVLSIPSGTDASTAKTVQVFNQNFGEHFIDIRKYLASYGVQIANELGANITVSSDDQTLINNGQVPQCLRMDAVHLNYWGYQVVARAVYEKGKDLGYWS